MTQNLRARIPRGRVFEWKMRSLRVHRPITHPSIGMIFFWDRNAPIFASNKMPGHSRVTALVIFLVPDSCKVEPEIIQGHTGRCSKSRIGRTLRMVDISMRRDDGEKIQRTFHVIICERFSSYWDLSYLLLNKKNRIFSEFLLLFTVHWKEYNNTHNVCLIGCSKSIERITSVRCGVYATYEHILHNL